MEEGKLTVGFLIESTEIPAWQFAMIEQVAASTYATVRLLTLPGSAPGSADDGIFSLYGLFRRQEERKRKPEPDACERMEVARLPGHIERRPMSGRRLASVTEDRTYDVIVALGGLAMLDDLAPVSRFGIWFYEHGSDQTERVDGATVGFHEVIRRRPHVRSRLLVRDAGSPVDRVAYESHSGVHELSHSLSRNEHLWKILAFVPRVLRKAHGLGEAGFRARLEGMPGTPRWIDAAKRGRLRNAHLLFRLASYAIWRLARRALSKVYFERWVLMFGPAGERLEPETFKLLRPPEGRFWADPFVVHEDGRHHVFFEDASIETWQGRLSVLTLDAAGEPEGPPMTVLERPYHLSYPFIFEWEGALYLIPESADNRTIEVYRCLRFPDQWTHEHNLMEGVRAYDATLIEHESTWWLFANVQERDGTSSWDELCLFYADQPLSRNWQPHPMNPIVSDVRSARPAGPMYRRGGKLYRPSQNSSWRYGYALNINEVLELTRTAYREKVIETVEPGWNWSIRGIHACCRAGSLTLVDVLHRERRTSNDDRRAKRFATEPRRTG